MSAVGGRMEAVAPRRSLFAPDYLRLAVLAAVSLAVHLWLVGHTAVTARDGIGFARYAASLQSPKDANLPSADPDRKAVVTPFDVIATQQQAPGYPVAVWAAQKVVAEVRGTPDPDRPELAVQYLFAAQCVSAAAALLLVVPTYVLGRMLLGRSAGFAAALLFQVLPVPARMTSDALSEATYLLVVATAVVLGVRAVRRPGVGAFLLCGLATGASYLVRPEGLMTAGAVGLIAAWLGLTRKWPRDLTAGRLTALVVGLTLVAGPYVLLIGKLSNKPTAKQILNPEERFPTRDEMLRGGKAEAPAVAGGPVFAAWWTVAPDAGVVWPAVVGAAKETDKGLHYGGSVLAVLGVVFLRRRIASEPGLCVLLALAGLNFLVLVALGVTGYYTGGKHTFYVSERHTVLLVMIGCVFAAAAIGPLADVVASVTKVGRRCVAAGLLLALVAAALPSTVKPLHTHREGHRRAGEWLAKTVQPGDCLVDPFEWAQWYSGRSLYFVPPDPPNPRVTYAVVDDKEHAEDHARLPRMKTARGVTNDGGATVAYHWPEDVPEAEAKVKVYRLIREKGK